MLDGIGWVATAIFTTSYFFRQPRSLRLIQAAAACVWMVYGLAIGAMPVVVANAIVAVAAVYSTFTTRSVAAALEPSRVETTRSPEPRASATGTDR
jgi:Bacterial inner membrane protein